MSHYASSDFEQVPFNYSGGLVSLDKLFEALDFFVSLEPEQGDPDPVEKVDRAIVEHAAEVEMAKAAIRQYGLQIEPKTLKNMQSVFYSITESARFADSLAAESIASSLLNSLWDGIGEWQK